MGTGGGRIAQKVVADLYDIFRVGNSRDVKEAY